MKSWLARRLYLGIQQLRGEPLLAALHDVRRSEWLSRDALQQQQMQRQRAQLLYALDHVAHYRKHFAPFRAEIEAATTFSAINDLMNALPVLERDVVRLHPTSLTSDEIDRLPTYPDKTSGSSGTPLIFPCDQRAWAYRHALGFRNMEAFGVKIGEPYGYFYGLHWSGRARREMRIRDWVLNRRRISAFDISKASVDRDLKALLTKQPTHLIGYPSAIYEFCALLHERGVDQLKRLRLKAVFLTSEPLLEHQRLLIEQITGARCVNQYGAAEGGMIAAECPAGNLHIHTEAVWLQTTSADAQGGEAVVTDMMLRAFPLIRYAQGDEIILKEGECACGRMHPLLDTVVGRSGEAILLPTGRRINANLPSYIFKPLAALGVIRHFRFVYRPDEPLSLYLVTNQGYLPEHEALIISETKKAFGADIELIVHNVEQMPLLPNAKHRTFVVEQTNEMH